MSAGRVPTVAGLVAALLAWAPAVVAQDEPASPDESAKLRAAQIAAEFSDPLTTLPQIFLNDAFVPASFGTEARTNTLTMRAIVPRVPSSALLPFVQLIRPTLSVVTVPTGNGAETRTELGDMQLFDIGVIPWPGRESGLLMGVGPVFVFPTATHPSAGSNAWQVGPAFAVIYKGLERFVVGALVQNPISFAYTEPGTRPINTLLVQPILLYYLGRGFYLKSGDATFVHGWKDGQPTLLPVSLGLGYVLLRDGWPPTNLFVSGEWMAWRDDAPVAPEWTVNFGITMAFPQWRPW